MAAGSRSARFRLLYFVADDDRRTSLQAVPRHLHHPPEAADLPAGHQGSQPLAQAPALKLMLSVFQQGPVPSRQRALAQSLQPAQQPVRQGFPLQTQFLRQARFPALEQKPPPSLLQPGLPRPAQPPLRQAALLPVFRVLPDAGSSSPAISAIHPDSFPEVLRVSAIPAVTSPERDAPDRLPCRLYPPCLRARP